MSGRQTIRCSVQSCKFYGMGDYCRLPAIEVAPQFNICSGVAEDETLCANYEPILDL